MKRIKPLICMAIMALATLYSNGQESKKLSLEDLIPGGKNYSNYRPSYLHSLYWKGDTLHWSENNWRYTLDAKHMKVSKAETPMIDKTRPVQIEKTTRRIYKNRDKSSQGVIAHTKGNNLWIDEIQLTDNPEGIVCGQTVSRNEFGISKGTFWSPNGRYLAYYVKDERKVSDYPIVDITKRVAKLEKWKYPMAGMESEKISVVIYDTKTKKKVTLNTGDPTNRYFTNITWGPKEEKLYLIELNRDQNHSKLCSYETKTGHLAKVLIEETNEKYVEPQKPIIFLPWDNDKFIYQSQIDGYNHLYIYNTSGKLIKQLTSGQWLVQNIVGIDAKKKSIIYLSTEISPLQSNIYKVSCRTGKRQLIGSNRGVHRAILSPSKRYLVDIYSSNDVPRQTIVYDLYKSKHSKVIQNAEDPMKGCDVPQIELGTIKAADGITDLYYRLTKPVDFDPNEKYPTVVYVYGGPHAQMIHDVYHLDADGRDIYMAQHGYVCFTLDNRGSSNRGLDFENVTFRQLGFEECKDQMKGVDFLKSLPYIDENRIGVHGWSFGGHMTIALMLRYPDTFKVGVAGGPVIDWKFYEVMYGERYMDTPQTNPKGYEACDLKNEAQNLKGRLLVIQDDHDVTVVPQNALSFIKACVNARTYPDLMIYPNHLHNVRGKDRIHLTHKIITYFDDFLKK